MDDRTRHRPVLLSVPDPLPGSGLRSITMRGVDIFSRKIVGWEVHERESADLAAVLIRQAVLAEGCIARPLVLHADNGSPPLVICEKITAGQWMKGATMKTAMEKLGITASYSRPRVSNDNPFSEALLRTCKYRPDWPTKGFATRADAQVWVKSFASWYNGEHLHSAIRCVTPDARPYEGSRRGEPAAEEDGGADWALVTLVSKFAKVRGVLGFWSGHILGRNAALIEYK